MAAEQGAAAAAAAAASRGSASSQKHSRKPRQTVGCVIPELAVPPSMQHVLLHLVSVKSRPPRTNVQRRRRHHENHNHRGVLIGRMRKVEKLTNTVTCVIVVCVRIFFVFTRVLPVGL